MIVLVEGPDGSGKTTLCSYLVERGFKYIHLSKTKNVYNLYDELIDQLKYSLDFDDVVIDRAYISNIVYSNVFNDSRYIDIHHLCEMNDLVDVIVLAIPSNKEKYLKRFENLLSSRNELYKDMEKVYDEFKSRNSFKFLLQDKNVFTYDIDKISEKEIENFADEELLKC